MPRACTLALIALLVAACAPTGSTQTAGVGPQQRAIKLLLGFRPDVQFAPFYVAQQQGYYADAGLEVTIEHQQAPAVMQLVADGQAEFGVADATDVMIARTSDIPIRYVSVLYRSFPVALIGIGEVFSDPPDLQRELTGMRIGTPGRYGSSWHALLALLDAGQLSVDQVTIREYPQFNQVEGLMNGDVDLITGFRNNEPLRLMARGQEVDVLTVDDVAPLPGPGIIVGDELLVADPELVRAFAQATARAQEAVIADPDLGFAAALAAVPAIAEDQDTAYAVLRATVELWAGDEFEGGRIDLALWKAGYETMRRLGFIDGSVVVDDMVAPEVLGSG